MIKVNATHAWCEPLEVRLLGLLSTSYDFPLDQILTLNPSMTERLLIWFLCFVFLNIFIFLLLVILRHGI